MGSDQNQIEVVRQAHKKPGFARAAGIAESISGDRGWMMGIGKFLCRSFFRTGRDSHQHAPSQALNNTHTVLFRNDLLMQSSIPRCLSPLKKRVRSALGQGCWLLHVLLSHLVAASITPIIIIICSYGNHFKKYYGCQA